MSFVVGSDVAIYRNKVAPGIVALAALSAPCSHARRDAIPVFQQSSFTSNSSFSLSQRYRVSGCPIFVSLCPPDLASSLPVDSRRLSVPQAESGLIRFGGHLPKGGYDVDHGGNEDEAAPPQLQR